MNCCVFSNVIKLSNMSTEDHQTSVRDHIKHKPKVCMQLILLQEYQEPVHLLICELVVFLDDPPSK